MKILKSKKKNFHKHKRPISIKKYWYYWISSIYKVSFGKKGFKFLVGHKDSKKFKPLCISLPKLSAYRKDFDRTKYVSFLIKDDKLLEKYNAIWEKVIGKTGKNYCPQMFLEECKYVVKEKMNFWIYYWWYRNYLWLWWRKFWWGNLP